jgi:2-polyprenyl-3-methyl-5-hydroxy-6-metoxy-1,4-benzoquinol methylase
MFRLRSLVAVLFLVGCADGAFGQAPDERDASWNAFIAWFKAAPVTANPFEDYPAKLQRDGKSDPEIRKEMALLVSIAAGRSDWIGIHFDKVYARPLSGNPASDGFNAQPSAFLVQSVQDVKPGTALDAAMGQGRNAVYLARQGWTVTGFDVSGEALAASRANASRAGVRLKTVQASYDGFDFGAEQWDLIVLAFAWAPVADPAFVERLRIALRPNGRVVFEHFVAPEKSRGPNIINVLAPNELRACFRDFAIVSYEEVDGAGDWGGPGSHLVRMIAMKR